MFATDILIMDHKSLEWNLGVLEIPHSRVTTVWQPADENEVRAEICPDKLIAMPLHTTILDLQIKTHDIGIDTLLKTLVEHIIGLAN